MTFSLNERHASLREDDVWWRSAVVYQVYPRSFLDSNGDGIGDLPGIIGKLDYLAELGIDVLWLSPVYASPQVDNGYDISDYREVDPLFGTLDDFDELISQAHARGIKIMMDMAANHTSIEHAWFQESRSSKNNPKRDWYWWRPAREGMEPGEPGAEPTNWKNTLSGSAWKLDETTGEYYLHMFSAKQPDLNWENPEVRAAIHDVMRWWLDRGVAGFRLDVINYISKHLPLRDSEDPDSSEAGQEFVLNGPRMHEFLKEMRLAVAGESEWVLSVGEMPTVSLEDACIYTNPAEQEIDMVFEINHLMADRGKGKHDLHELNLPEFKRTFAEWQVALHNVGWNSLYLSNHDQARQVSRFGDDGEYRVESAKMLATILHMMEGTPYVYQGEELGMTNFPFTSLEQFQDIETRAHVESAAKHADYDPHELLTAVSRSSRENARTPMQWDDSDHAGFTSGQPWMPVNPNAGMINANQAVADDDSVFHYYRRLIELRHTMPIVVHGKFELLLEDDEQVFAYTRTLEEEQLLVIGNFSGDDVEVPLENASDWITRDILIGNYPVTDSGSDLVLKPWEARVYHRH